ncbi:MAG: hypothetical protein TECD_00636 [Hyphomicrobiaceae bacterium hypho_1]
MRQGQQNRRGRSRNRKGQNPMTRSFESSGPDIKIRGTPSHIAEKYISLARDALASGDPVLAENYLQHAEHYNRIIMIYREQQPVNVESISGTNENRNRSQEVDETEEDSIIHNTDESTLIKHTHNTTKHVTMNGDAKEEISSDLSQRSERQERRSRRSNNVTVRNSTRSRRNGSRRDSNNDEASFNSDSVISNSDEMAYKNRKQDAFSTGDESPPDFLKRPVRRVRQTVTNESKSSTLNEYENLPDKSGD